MSFDDVRGVAQDPAAVPSPDDNSGRTISELAAKLESLQQVAVWLMPLLVQSI